MGTSSGGGVPRPARVSPVSLRQLAAGRGTIAGGAGADGSDVGDVAVTGVTAASGWVAPGDLFVALPGSRAHGAAFAPDAAARGAVAVLTDPAGAATLTIDLPVVVVPHVRPALGPVAADVYGRPSADLAVLGVTGTSGKTTTTFLMHAGLRAAGRVPGLIGTVATLIGEQQIKTGFTTPEAPELQALLAVMRERGVTDVAMEVSSHALAMDRVGGTGFRTAGFTNLSEDHLDFHADMADYFAAKARLFDADYTERPVIVVDDHYGRSLADKLAAAVTVSSGTDDECADWRASQIVERPDGTTTFRVTGPGDGAGRPVDLEMGCAIPGRYNVANAVLALALLCEDGLEPADVAAAVSTATVPGRMERVDAGQPFLAVVDYSHKPAAVEGALRALRPLTRGRLVIVLGCGGDRDRGKRPHMGEIATRGADLLVVTDDNPRSEDPAAIRAAMLAGAHAVPRSERGEVVEIGERGAAIATAIGAARAGDTVLVAGKGHETGQEVAGIVHPFDDRDQVRLAIESVGAGR